MFRDVLSVCDHCENVRISQCGKKINLSANKILNNLVLNVLSFEKNVYELRTFPFLKSCYFKFVYYFIYTSKLGNFEVRDSGIHGVEGEGQYGLREGGQLPLPRSLNSVPEYSTKISENFHKTCYVVVSLFETYVLKLIKI